MIDVKKFVTCFLILAAAAACSGLIIATTNSFQTSSEVVTTAGNPTIATSSPATNINNFFPEEPIAVAATSSNSFTPATSSDPNNLTDVLAANYVNAVAVANPNGPGTDPAGNPLIESPDSNAVASEVAATPALSSLKTPNWDIEAESQPIKISSNASPDAVTAYANALNDILNQHFASTNVQDAVNDQSGDATQVPYVASQIKSALGDVLALQVPQPLANFQKSFVKVLVYEKNDLQLIENASSDPLKTSLTIQNEQNQYLAALGDLQTQMQKVSALGFSIGNDKAPKGNDLGFVNKILGIKTANAIFGLGDITFDPAVFGRLVLDYANDIILQILKNTLIALIQQKVLTWIQGSGAPRFITNWATTIVSAYEQTALSAINSQFSCISANPYFGPLIKLQLGVYYKPGNNICANTFQAALGGSTLQQFVNNFQNGGWVAFGAIQLPTNGFYGATFFEAQIADYNGRNAQQANIAKATANQGQKGDEVCSDGSNPNGTYTVCENPFDATSYTLPSGGTCSQGYTSVTYNNNGVCTNGTEPQVTTPGLYTGAAAASVLDSPVKLVASANNIAGILNALTSSLLNSLASLAVNSATTAINGGISGISAGGIQGGGTPPPPLPLSCSPNIEQTSSTIPALFAANGGRAGASGAQPIYTWNSSDGQTGTGFTFNPTYTFPGTYTITLTDSTGDIPATCQTIVQ